MKKVLTIMSLMALIFIISRCRKDEMCPNLEEGKIISSLYGCGLIIELDNGMKLEPINLSDFDTEFEVGQDILVAYHEDVSRGSYCMNGKIVELDCIHDQ